MVTPSSSPSRPTEQLRDYDPAWDLLNTHNFVDLLKFEDDGQIKGMDEAPRRIQRTGP